ncbi:GntR family transcriptional regulator/MocR family aminotransferase [Mucilaginibacter sp. SG538B]|uniref:MocR-like pyridoxine biosynthesis transcription factor PdxR n=1 Tax=Mucilaginibacter sp. SG538B TaxID=2587021 RepID=UPI00159E3732|nr:PLP-dependent aminotransferase family protein [Mucilaginibacter sp. SG538B]NVM67284.1 GntR family transcriptional regulator/MocR family aminotransferase [Mucilaginibacter sp. SG538B]
MIEKLLEITFHKDGQRGSLYQQLESEIIQLICRGILKPGQALPSSRVLAERLGFNRKTVVATYEELNAQGWVETKDRSGVYVSSQLPEIAVRKVSKDNEKLARTREPGYSLMTRQPFNYATVDDQDGKLSLPGTGKPQYKFDDGFPDPRIAPIEELVREYRRLGKGRFANKFLMYGPEYGSFRLRVELAKYLDRTRGLQVTEKEILITKGTQMAIYLASQLLINPGDTVFVPEPGYFDANQTFKLAGANLVFIPVDKEGMDIDRIEELCKQKVPRLIYIIPHHHRPTTVTLSAERRMRLMNLASKYGFALLEDDYDFDYHFASDPLFPLASVDPGGHIIYVGSFCKSIAPGIRIGFMVAPEAVINEAAAIRRLIDRQGEQLLEEATAELLIAGDISRHIKRSHKIYQKRLENTCRLLSEHLGEYLTFDKPNGGLAIWASYRDGISAGAVARNAAKLGLRMSDGRNYFFEPHVSKPRDFIRMGYSSLDEKEMAEAVNIWKKALMPFSPK